MKYFILSLCVCLKSLAGILDVPPMGKSSISNIALGAVSGKLDDISQNWVISTWGDSLNAGIGTTNYDWGLRNFTGLRTIQHGYGGQSATYIRQRFEEHPAEWNNLQVFGAGRNYLNPTNMVAEIAQMVSDIATVGNSNYLIVSLIPFPSDTIGGYTYSNITYANGLLRSNYGNRYVDVMTGLCSTNSLNWLGITPTELDLTAIANGVVPPSLTGATNDGHLNDKGYLFEAYCLYTNGWPNAKIVNYIGDSLTKFSSIGYYGGDVYSSNCYSRNFTGNGYGVTNVRGSSILAGTIGFEALSESAISQMQAATVTNDLKTGLAGYWSMDETNGDALDLSGRGNTMKSYLETPRSSGLYSNAANFSAVTTNHLYCTNINIVTTPTWTMSGWFYLTNYQTYNYLFAQWNNTNTAVGGSPFMLIAGMGGTIYWYGDYAGRTWSPGYNMSTNHWHFIACSYDGSFIRIKFNAYSTNYPYGYGFRASSLPLTIGGDFTGTNSINGRADECAFWNRALTINELDKLYNYGAPLPYGTLFATNATILSGDGSGITNINGSTGIQAGTMGTNVFTGAAIASLQSNSTNGVSLTTVTNVATDVSWSALATYSSTNAAGLSSTVITNIATNAVATFRGPFIGSGFGITNIQGTNVVSGTLETNSFSAAAITALKSTNAGIANGNLLSISTNGEISVSASTVVNTNIFQVCSNGVVMTAVGSNGCVGIKTVPNSTYTLSVGGAFNASGNISSGAAGTISSGYASVGALAMSSASGGIQSKGATSANASTYRSGYAYFTAGSVTITNTSTTSADLIIAFVMPDGNTSTGIGTCYTTNHIPGTSFTIKSTFASDTNKVGWVAWRFN